MREQRVARAVVELVDTLAAGGDVIEFLQVLAERCLDVLEADAVGVLLADQRGVLSLMAASPEHAPVHGADALAQSFADMAGISIPHIPSRAHHQVLAEQLRTALRDRITVEQAKGVLSERRRIGVAEAFTVICAWARRERKPAVAVARAVLAGDREVAGLLARDA